MHKRWATILTMIMLATLVAVSAHAADVAKIGIIDFQRLFELSEAGKAATTEFNKEGKAREVDLKEKATEIEELKKRLEREALVMSKEKRDERERDIKIKLYDFNNLQKKYTDELRDVEKKLKRVIRDEIFALVEKIGREEGYLLIMEKRESGIIYSPDTIDITDQLIKVYNEQWKQKNN